MRLEVTIEGMLSVHARHAVFAALGGVAGIQRADVELGRAEIDAEGDLGALERAVGEAVHAVGCRVVSMRPLPRELPQL